jgi:dephospho-CoA kinase
MPTLKTRMADISNRKRTIVLGGEIMGKPLKIGLTGGLGSGKSLVLKLLQKKGIPVLQTDHLGHEILKEKKFSKALTGQFGKGILDRRGIIDRKKLGAVVFNRSSQRKKLNELLHPEIRKRVARWITRQSLRRLPYGMVVVEVPLLFERGYNRFFDRVLCVSAPAVQRHQRLLKRGWNLSEIRLREKTQWSQTRKNSKADWIIFNQSDPNDLEYAVNRWLERFE